MTGNEILFYTLYILPFVILLLYKDNGYPAVLKFSCANILMLFYMLVNHVALFAMYDAIGGIKQLHQVNNDIVILLAFYTLIVVLAYVLTGIIFGARYTHIRIPNISSLKSDVYNAPILYAVILISLPIALAKFSSDSPALILLQGDNIIATESRLLEVTTGESFLGIKSSYLDVIWTLLGFVQIVAFVGAVTQRKRSLIIAFIASTLVAFFSSFVNTAKGGVVQPILVVSLVYTLVFCNGKLINKVAIRLILLSIPIISIFSTWVMGNDILEIFGPIERLTLGNLLPQYVVVENFGYHNMLLGKTTPSWFSFGGHEQFLLDVWVWQELMGGLQQIFYTAPSSFVAEGHANWSVLGVAGMSFFIFFAIRIIDYWLKKVKLEYLYVSLIVFSAIHFSKLSNKGGISFLIDYGYWSVLLFAYFMYKISISNYNVVRIQSKNLGKL